MPGWRKLVGEQEHGRFASIMRMMDDRYAALCPAELQEWLARKEGYEKHPELLGWFDSEAMDFGSLRQVMATTCGWDDQGNRSNLGISMLGIAADVIPESQWADKHIEIWLARIILCLKSLIGLGVPFRAIRPKTMTWKPAEKLHDLMQHGIYLMSDDPQEGVLHAGVIEEKDLGDSLYWRMQVVQSLSADPTERVIDCGNCSRPGLP